MKKYNRGYISIFLVIIGTTLGSLLLHYSLFASAYYKNILETDISYIKSSQYSDLWKHLSLYQKQKFSNEDNFTNFMKNKYHPLSISIKNLTVLKHTNRETILSVILNIQSPNKNYIIPKYYNNSFQIVLNNDNQFVRMGQFSLKSPIVKNTTTGNMIMDIPIVMLHRVAPTFPQRSSFNSQYGYSLDYNLTLLSSSFKMQLKWLKENNYQTITLTQLYNHYYYNTTIPKKPIVLTFDDGRLSAYKYGVPTLLKYHDTATFNIITGFVGSSKKNYKYMTWPIIKKMQTEGMQIESHTVTHLALGSLPTNLMQYQILISKQKLEQELGVPIQFLAYPSGSPFRNNDVPKIQELTTLMEQDGYIGGLLDQRYNQTKQNLENSYHLYRIRDSGNISLSQFIYEIQSTG
ncbi:MAG: polysaccharide deacetylase family protein [Patescibacteria group bacterium]